MLLLFIAADLALCRLLHVQGCSAGLAGGPGGHVRGAQGGVGGCWLGAGDADTAAAVLCCTCWRWLLMCSLMWM